MGRDVTHPLRAQPPLNALSPQRDSTKRTPQGLTARIFFSSCSAMQGHQPLTVFCSKRDTKRLADKLSSMSSKEHFSAVLAGLGILLRSIWMEPAGRNAVGRPLRVTAHRITDHSGWRRPQGSPGPIPTHPTTPPDHLLQCPISTVLEYLQGQ